MSDQGSNWSRVTRPAAAPAPHLPPPALPAAAPPPPPAVFVETARISVAEVDAELAPAGRSRRAIGLVIVGGAVVIVAVVVGVRAARHAPASAGAPEAPIPAAPAPVIAPVAAALAAPAAPPEIALDPGAPAAPTERPAATEDAPRAHRRLGAAHEHVPRAHEHVPRAHERRRLTPTHKLAKAAKPAGDRAAAHAAYQRGNGLLLTGNATGAVEAYREAVRLAPSDPSGYRGLGLAYEKEGRIKDAIGALVSYLKISRHARDREVIARRLYRLTHPENE